MTEGFQEKATLSVNNKVKERATQSDVTSQNKRRILFPGRQKQPISHAPPELGSSCLASLTQEPVSPSNAGTQPGFSPTLTVIVTQLTYPLTAAELPL